jgi:hypothetical protein
VNSLKYKVLKTFLCEMGQFRPGDVIELSQGRAARLRDAGLIGDMPPEEKPREPEKMETGQPEETATPKPEPEPKKASPAQAERAIRPPAKKKSK